MEWGFAYLALGALVGLLGGMFGIGGGTILVPVLLYFFQIQNFPADHAMHMALGSAMATILFTSLSSMYKHHQHGMVSWPAVYTLAPGAAIGTALGAVFATHTSSRMLGIFFSFFVCFTAIQILLNVRPRASRKLPGIAGMATTGALAGWVSGLVSIGGGTLIVPFLIWCNIPVNRAIGTSAAIGFPIAVGGTIGYIATGLSISTLPSPNLGFVYLPSLFWIALASVITAPFGAKIAHRMNVGLLRKLLAILMLATATYLLIRFI